MGKDRWQWFDHAPKHWKAVSRLLIQDKYHIAALCMRGYVAKLVPVIQMQGPGIYVCQEKGVLGIKWRPGVAACVISIAFAQVRRAHFKTKLPACVKRAHCRICMRPSAQLAGRSWIFFCFHDSPAPPLAPSIWSWALWPNRPCWNVNTLPGRRLAGFIMVSRQCMALFLCFLLLIPLSLDAGMS